MVPVQCTCIFLICSWRSFNCSWRLAATPTLTFKRSNSRIRAIQGYLQSQHSLAQLFHEALQVGHLSSIQIIWGIGRPLTSCSTFLCLFVTQPPMFSWTVTKCQMKCISCAFARCISCYILSEFSHSRCQGPSLLLTTAPIDASYNFTLYLDAWKKRPTVMRLWRKDEAKKGDQAEVGFALVDP